MSPSSHLRRRMSRRENESVKSKTESSRAPPQRRIRSDNLCSSGLERKAPAVGQFRECVDLEQLLPIMHWGAQSPLTHPPTAADGGESKRLIICGTQGEPEDMGQRSGSGRDLNGMQDAAAARPDASAVSIRSLV